MRESLGAVTLGCGAPALLPFPGLRFCAPRQLGRSERGCGRSVYSRRSGGSGEGRGRWGGGGGGGLWRRRGRTHAERARRRGRQAPRELGAGLLRGRLTGVETGCGRRRYLLAGPGCAAGTEPSPEP